MKSGELRDRLERYLAVRRAVGFTMRAQEPRLRSFVTFVERREPDGTLRAQRSSPQVDVVILDASISNTGNKDGIVLSPSLRIAQRGN